MFARTISAISAIAMALSLATAVPAQAQNAPQVRIAFVSGPLYDSFFPPLYQGAHDAAADLGVDLNYIPIDEHDIEASSARTMQAAMRRPPMPSSSAASFRPWSTRSSSRPSLRVSRSM